MIALNYDLTTGIAKLAQPAVIKLGADVPVKLTFSAAPGDVTSVQFALGTDAAAPAVLAFTEDFEDESETVFLALLDANDARLIAHLAGSALKVVKAELITVIDGAREVTPNLDVTVQQALVAGPEETEGGPTYYTEAEVDALLLGYAPRTVAAKYRIKTDGAFQLWNADQTKWHTLTLSGAAGAEQLNIAAGEA